MVSAVNIIQAIAFVDLLAVGHIVPLLVMYARKIGASHIEVGLVGSIFAGFQLGSGPLIGSLSDLKGRRPVLIMNLLVCSVAYTTIGFTSSIYIVLLLRAVIGIFKQTQMLTKAMVPDYESDEMKQGEIYGKLMAIASIGITLGPVIGGHIVEDFPENGFLLVAVIVGSYFILNAGLVALLPSQMFEEKQKVRKTESVNFVLMFCTSLKQSFLALYNIEWSQFGDIFLLRGLLGFSMGVYYAMYSTYLKDQFELTPKYIGYIISFQGMIGSMSSYFISFINSFYSNDKDYSIRNFHVCLLLTVALIGVILSFNVYLFVLWLIPLCIGNAVGRLTTLEMVLNRSHGTHRGKLIGAINSVRSMSGVASPMIAGTIGECLGVKYVMYLSLLSTSLALILSYKRKQKRLTNKID